MRIIQYCASAITLIVGLLLMTVLVSAKPNPLSWEHWKTDFDKTNIDLAEIISGGPPKDGIPAIDDPKFIGLEFAKALHDREPVIGLEINGDARAYPLGVLMRHEIANDIVGGQPVTVTYCPLCNSAIVFDAMIEGKRHDFGTTGRLRNSDLVMYDRQSETWWQQFNGEALIGKYLGKQLKTIPSRIESFANFKKRFPNGRVMTGVNGSLTSYGRNPYVGYDTASRPFLYHGSMPDGIDPMARVIVVRDGNVKMAIAMAKIRKKGGMSTGGYNFSWTKGQASALDTSVIANGREVGNITVSKQKDGKTADVAYEVTFAFVAHAFMPEVEIVK